MGGYKEHKIFDMLKRKSIIIKYIVTIALIFIVTTILIIETTKSSKIKNVVYTEDSKVGYKVYLKENDFFERNYLEENNQYIASLIDYIEADFSYELSASEKNINYKYAYRVEAEVDVKDKNSSNSLYKYTEDLISEKEYDANTNTTLKINEPVKVDYNKYNDIINRFINVYDLDNCNANVTINMFVDIDKNENEEKDDELPVVSLTIPLTTKTIAIDLESNEVNQNSVNVNKKINNGKYFIALILIITDIALITKLVIFIKDTEDEKSVYKMLIRKILANYGSYIQKINRDFDFNGYQSIELKNFEDLLQIREIVQAPILMLKGTDETHFMVPTNGKLVYIYEIDRGNKKARINDNYQQKNSADYEIKI